MWRSECGTFSNESLEQKQNGFILCVLVSKRALIHLTLWTHTRVYTQKTRINTFTQAHETHTLLIKQVLIETISRLEWGQMFLNSTYNLLAQTPFIQGLERSFHTEHKTKTKVRSNVLFTQTNMYWARWK